MSIFVKNLGELVSVTDKYKNAQNESRFQSFVIHIRYQRIPSGNLESVFWFKLNPSTNLTYWLRAHYNPVQGEGLEVFKATSLKPLVFLWGFFCCLSTSGTGDSPGCCSIGLHTGYIVGAVTLMLCNPVHRQQDNSHVKSTWKSQWPFPPTCLAAQLYWDWNLSAPFVLLLPQMPMRFKMAISASTEPPPPKYSELFVLLHCSFKEQRVAP